MIKPYYKTSYGEYYLNRMEDIISSKIGKLLSNNVQLILTSPPFPLNKKKRYGNLQGDEYKEWFNRLGNLWSPLLKEDGSIVIEMGNSWIPQRPIQSTMHLECLLSLLKESEKKDHLRLIQEFICYNPARLPSPSQWVTIKRIRMTDSFTHVWWIAKSDYPKADNKKVLRPYSKNMLKLLKTQKYNSGLRPSEHKIGQTSFLKDHNGSIMPNFIEIESITGGEIRKPNCFSIANTASNDLYHQLCRKQGMIPHPARMPLELASLFIEFLTDPGDIVFDPFGGSNTTGYCAEVLKRKWIASEVDVEYAKQSRLRFTSEIKTEEERAL